MSDKKESIDLTPLSEETINKENTDLSDLWMVKTQDGSMHGPFDTASLQQYSAQHQQLFEQAMAYNLLDETWKQFFKIATFQRRKPKLVPLQSLVSNENFLVLQGGQKTGPFTVEQIQQMLESKSIALNVQVSLDNGESWIKLYEHHEFDRRLKKKAEDLPFVPKGEILNSSWALIQEKIEQAKFEKTQEEKDALVGLAFIGCGNDRGQTYSNIKDSSADHNTHNGKSLSSKLTSESYKDEGHFVNWLKSLKENTYVKVFGGGFTIILLAFTAFNSFNTNFNSNIDNQLASDQVQTDPKGIENSNRTEPSLKTKNIKSSKSFVRAKKYKQKPSSSNVGRYESKRSRRPASIRNNANNYSKKITRQRKVYRQVHTHEETENNDDNRYDDIDTPETLEVDTYAQDADDIVETQELTREVAGDSYTDDYEEISDEQREFIERANDEGFSESDYDDLDNEGGPYEVVNDFE